MLHITNGDHANLALKQQGIEGRYLSWNDVLHDGPVPAELSLDEMSRIRANFIHHCGWASVFEAQTHFQTRDAVFLSGAKEGEVVIWNSHELYDQLHLLQLLGWYSSDEGRALARPELVFVPHLISDAEEKLVSCFEQRTVVSDEQLAEAEALWISFTGSNPRALAAMTQQDMPALPFMQRAMQRFMEEYPDQNGVNRTERQVLAAVAAGQSAPGQVFAASQNAENPRFMGDSSFWLVVKRMVESDTPLLTTQNGQQFQVAGMFGPDETFMAQTLSLTLLGESVLAGEGDWLQGHVIDRWLGGVHLNPDNIWRWDANAQQISRG